MMETFKYDGKDITFIKGNYADLARKLFKLNNREQWTSEEAKRLYRNTKRNMEIITNNKIGYIDTSKKISPQLINLGLRYNVNIKKRVSTGMQKGERLYRGQKYKGIKDIISIASIGKDRQDREELDITKVGKLEGNFSVKFGIQISDKEVVRTLFLRDKILDPQNPDEFNNAVIDAMDAYAGSIGRIAEALNYSQIVYYPNSRIITKQRRDKQVSSIKTKSKINVRAEAKDNEEGEEVINYFIRDLKPLDIKGLFNVDLYEYENPDNKNCLINFLENHYKKNKNISKSLKNYINGIPTFENFKNFVSTNKIKTSLYDITGKCIYKQKIKSSSKHANIRAIIHNNHIYTFKKGVRVFNRLEKREIEIEKDNKNVEMTELIQDHNQKIIEYINKGIMPNIISSNHFIVDDKHHICNKDYSEIEKIYKIFGFEDAPLKCNSFSVLNDIIKIIEENPVKSYFPYNYKEKGLGYTGFENIEDIDINSVYAIDANKAYASSLASLDYLPEIDIRYDKVYKYEGGKIYPHCLYTVNTTSPSVYFPDNSAFVWGWYIIRIQEIEQMISDKIEYTITEYITCKMRANYYKYIIEKLFNDKEDDTPYMDVVKLAVNIHIGNMQKIIGEKKVKKQPKKIDYSIMTVEHIEGLKNIGVDEKDLNFERIDDNYYLSYRTIPQFEVHSDNNLPLSYAIIQNSRLKMINKLLDMNVETDDIIQIKTDAIYLNNKNNKFKKIETSNKLHGWKELKNIKLDDFKYFDYTPTPQISLYEPHIINKFIQCNNVLAGGGKTYQIINNLLPNLKDDAVVLSSFHMPLSEYRQKGIKSNVISHYLYHNKKPEEKNIIIDELGLMKKQEWDFILDLLNTHDKNIFLFGDNKQLPPVNDYAINDIFLKSHSENYNTDWINHRNNFKAEDYEEMINKNNDMEFSSKLIKKYCSSDINDNETVFIAYRKGTRKNTNNIIMEKNKYIMNEDNISVGVKLINKTNNLIIDNTTIYNKHQFVVVENNDEGVVIEDIDGKRLKATRKQILNNMELAFCLTLYCVQGQTIPKLHFLDVDIDVLTKIPNALYTLISRIKNN